MQYAHYMPDYGASRSSVGPFGVHLASSTDEGQDAVNAEFDFLVKEANSEMLGDFERLFGTSFTSLPSAQPLDAMGSEGCRHQSL
jgi:hypothetical protein